MSTTASRPTSAPDLGYRPGPLGRLGVWVSDHARITTVVVVCVALRRRLIGPLEQ